MLGTLVARLGRHHYWRDLEMSRGRDFRSGDLAPEEVGYGRRMFGEETRH